MLTTLPYSFIYTFHHFQGFDKGHVVFPFNFRTKNLCILNIIKSAFINLCYVLIQYLNKQQCFILINQRLSKPELLSNERHKPIKRALLLKDHGHSYPDKSHPI